MISDAKNRETKPELYRAAKKVRLSLRAERSNDLLTLRHAVGVLSHSP